MSAAVEPGLAAAPAVHEVAVDRLGPAVVALMASGAQYLTAAAVDEAAVAGRFRIDHVFRLPGQPELRILRSHVPAERPQYPSLTPVLPAVHWDEREAMDLFGAVALGHPDPRRLVLPDDWPAGLHPLRRHVPWNVHPNRGPSAWQPRTAEGDGVVVMPVGPVHAGIIESGHFTFSLMGETILHLDLRMFQKHRGIEKVLEGQHWAQAATTVERICAGCSASHQAAWAEAVEMLLGWEIPARAVHLRTILLESERLYNHIGDIAAIPAGTGYTGAAMAGAGLKERMLRMQGRHFGHRYLFDTIRPGGVTHDLPASEVPGLRRELADVRAQVAALAERMLRHPGFADRIRGTGTLTPAAAADLGAVGPSARASGIGRDLRIDRPYLGYQLLAPSVPTEAGGDVAARLRIRFREVEVSFELVDRLLSSLPSGEHSSPAPSGADGAEGLAVSCNESPRGANVHYVELSGGRITRYRVRSASFANWPLLMAAVPGNLIGDFPLINKSFELCYACCDR